MKHWRRSKLPETNRSDNDNNLANDDQPSLFSRLLVHIHGRGELQGSTSEAELETAPSMLCQSSELEDSEVTELEGDSEVSSPSGIRCHGGRIAVDEYFTTTRQVSRLSV
jgi:hypothetical protein